MKYPASSTQRGYKKSDRASLLAMSMLIFEAFAEEYDLKRHISFNTLVEDVTWDAAGGVWILRIRQSDNVSFAHCKYLIVCNGM